MLRQMRIKNFQSIVDVTYNFSEGLNVIVAPNNTGKSIINKIIDVLVNSKSIKSYEMQQYITFGKPKSDIFVSDEVNTYWIEIYPKKINYYKLENDSFIFIGNELPRGLINALGLLICEDNFVGNLITSNHSKLLVDSSASINNQILSLIARDDNAENIIEECENRMSIINSNLRTLRSKRNFLEKELSSIEVEDTTYREECLKRVFGLTEFTEELVGVYEKSEELNPNKGLKNKLDGLLDFCSDLEKVNYKFNYISDSKVINNLDRDLATASELESIIDKLNSITKRCKFINEVKKCNLSDDFMGTVSRLEIIKSNLNKVVLKDIPSHNKLKSCTDLDSLVNLFNDYYYKCLELNKDKLELDKLKAEIDSYGGEVYDCPIHGTIKFVNEECIRYSN